MENRTITISLLHASRGRPEQALRVRQEWLDAAAQPERVEHRFAVDGDDPDTIAAVAQFPHGVVTETGGGCVAAWNLAASQSKGDILVQLSDDWEPVTGWDDQFARRLRDVAQPGVLRVSDGHRTDDLLCMAIFTRPWLEQLGTFLHPGYFSMFSDDEFSFRAYEAGVVIDARDLVLRHVHPSFDGTVEEDETYRRQNASEHFFKGEAIFLKRYPEALGRWLHSTTGRRHYLAKSHVGEIAGLSATGTTTARSAASPEAEKEWREFGKKCDALLVAKSRHAKIYGEAARWGLSVAEASLRSLSGRFAWNGDRRRRLEKISEVHRKAESQLKDGGIKSFITTQLHVSAEVCDLLDEIRENKLGRMSVDAQILGAAKSHFKTLQRWWDEASELSETRPDLIGSSPWPAPPHEGIPVFITSFNQLTYLRNMIRQLRSLGVPHHEIHVIDNHSTWPPLADYLDEIEASGMVVHRLGENLGPRALFDRKSGIELPPVFALTDPDLQFHADLPTTFREDLLRIALLCRVWKAGFALNIQERDLFRSGPYFQGETISDWEEKFWSQPVTRWNSETAEELGNLSDKVYWAGIDTTFAVCIRDRKGPDWVEAVRVAGYFEARHLPWYAASEEDFPPSPNVTRVESGLCLADGRSMVRPGPCEIDHYVNKGFGSTISRMESKSSRDYTTVTHPGTSYPLAVPPGTTHESWWKKHFEAGTGDRTIEILRRLSMSTQTPARLIDIGCSFGRVTLWSALRFEHVYAVDQDEAAVGELAKLVAMNRFEACVTLAAGRVDTLTARDDSPHEDSSQVFTIHSLIDYFDIPLEDGGLFIRCDLGGEEEILLEDLILFASKNSDKMGCLIITAHAQRWKNPECLPLLFERTVGRQGALAGWKMLGIGFEEIKAGKDIVSPAGTSTEINLVWVNPSPGTSIEAL